MPDTAAAFDSLSAEFYEAWFHYHPDLALAAGVPLTGRLLPAQGDDDLAALGVWLEELLLGLDELDFAALDPDRQLDLELMAGAARVEHRELRGHDWRLCDPMRGLPTAALDRFAPPVGPADAGVRWRLLEAIPPYVREIQGHLRGGGARLAPLLVQAAAREAGLCQGRLRALANDLSWCPADRESDQAQALADGAARALEAHRRFLAEALAPQACGPLGCGGEHLRYRLHHLHFIDWDPSLGWEPVERALAGAQAILAAAGAAGEVPADAPAPGAATPVNSRLPRRLANGVTLTQGLALYLAARRGSAGCAWGQEALLRARLDLGLHRGRIEATEALACLNDHGFDQEAAEATLVGLARSPGDALAGLLGWQLLERSQAQGGAVAGCEAHELPGRLLSQGAIPLLLALRRLGEARG